MTSSRDTVSEELQSLVRLGAERKAITRLVSNLNAVGSILVGGTLCIGTVDERAAI